MVITAPADGSTVQGTAMPLLVAVQSDVGIADVELFIDGASYELLEEAPWKFTVDTTAYANGPLLFIPGSHKKGVVEAGHDLETTSYPLWTLDRATVKQLADEGGVVAPVGEPGSVLLFHGNLVHASPPNISPWDRVIVYLSLCAVSNHITKFTRKPWIAHRDFTPIKALADDCLQELVDQAKAKTAAE